MHIHVYVGDISGLEDNKDRQTEILNNLSDYRREKVLKCKNENGRALSLGAGYLLKLAFEKIGVKENSAEYGFSENGKPYLLSYPDIHFNISHSNERILCVCAKGEIELGCDVERIRSGKLAIAKRFFTEYENKLLEECLSDVERDELFFELWTLKESFIKCTGEGLGRSMNSFEFYKYRGNYRIRFMDISSDKSERDSGDEKKESSSFKLKVLKNISFINKDDSGAYKYSICYKTEKSLRSSDFEYSYIMI